MTIRDIATWIGARLVGNNPIDIRLLLTDSRSLSFPEETLFFAIVTKRGDGHKYIADLYRQGVRAFVVQQLPTEHYEDACFLIVPDSLSALQRLAERRREEFDIPIIGIAGSNGKTTVKEWLYQMLSPAMRVTRSPRSYNSQIGVPLSVWTLDEDSEIGLFEAGISQRGEMEALQRIIQPTIGIFTCLGPAHQENFLSMRQKCVEKLKLFRDAEHLFYPENEQLVTDCIAEVGFRGQLHPISIQPDASYLTANAALCEAVCAHLEMDKSLIQKGLNHLEPIAMRLEVKEGVRGCTLINDAYNSDLNSLDIALDFMNRRPETTGRQHCLILSDIEQSGERANSLYKKVAQLIQSRGITHFIGVGSELSSNSDLFVLPGIKREFFQSTKDLLESDTFTQMANEVILLKGARSFHFEQLVDLLEQRVHETILEVNLSALVDNLNYYRSFLKPETRMICMVKAGGYGAGSVELARCLQDQGVSYLAVAVADEGVELRQAGITAGIIIMNPEMSSLHTLFQYNLEPEVYSFRLLDALIKAGEQEGITGFPVHIKLDTGMHRLGFDPMLDMHHLTERLRSQSALMPRSVFSHFVGSDSDEFDDFSARQYELFLHGADSLQAAFGHHILRHMCNSAGIEHFPERQMDMVRLGLGLYGINPRNNEMLNNVSTLKTTILQIHDVPATDTVGYSRNGHLSRNSRIAAIPIGYADGMDRHLGNGHAYCLINGKQAPYVGNICMDVCMIDVTDIPCQEGDMVTIFGSELPVTVLSDVTGTIPYEILTSISSRVKRVYYRD